MRKDSPPPPPTQAAASIARILSCFETKPLLATLLALTTLLLLFNLPPYHLTLLPPSASTSAAFSTPSCSSRSSPNSTTLSLNLNLNLASIPNNSTSVVTTSILSSSSSPKKYSASLPQSPPDPSKRSFLPYGNAAALFVLMGGYRGGPATFSVVGLASKPLHVYGRPWYKCEWVPNPTPGNSNPPAVRAKAYKMLPDWGYGRVYTVVVVNCTFATNPNPDNVGGKLNLLAYYNMNPRRFEKFVAMEELPGAYDESKYSPPYGYEYLYCGSSLYGNISAQRMREWMAYHAWFFGDKSHFVFHDAGGVSPEVRMALEPWIRLGRATVWDIRGQSEFDGYYYNQFLIVNDCLHRYRQSANWTFFFDVDEYLYLPDGHTLEGVLKEFGNYTQFTIEQNPMSSKLCLEDPTRDYSREWGFEKLLFRDSRTGIRRDRKYAIQARNAFATGVHMSENAIGGALHKTEDKIRYYHYHNTITVPVELCRDFLPVSAKHNVTWRDKRPFVYDDRMMRLAQKVKAFEREALGNLIFHPAGPS
ncbi:hypothetical protein MLD38_012797 [Melastoma candidum]|uniref:Uncharacterized protein n=1 Tax=Melastoma candidum TaxID=119954 RepID=A0ACB9R8S2_9MYRT|nr:hypothetical protein MLD38_012797 [Melastoma candidum]